MKPQELRIGNYVDTVNRSTEIHLPNNYPLKVGRIEFFKVVLYEIDESFASQQPTEFSIADLSPISLNEQWLDDFGLMEEDDFYNLRDGWDIYCHYSSMDNCAHIWGMTGKTPIFGDDFFIIKCEYVHTFQNAVFSLTGNELTK